MQSFPYLQPDSDIWICATHFACHGTARGRRILALADAATMLLPSRSTNAASQAHREDRRAKTTLGRPAKNPVPDAVQRLFDGARLAPTTTFGVSPSRGAAAS
jgi:hypothetical protein